MDVEIQPVEVAVKAHAAAWGSKSVKAGGKVRLHLARRGLLGRNYHDVRELVVADQALFHTFAYWLMAAVERWSDFRFQAPGVVLKRLASPRCWWRGC